MFKWNQGRQGTGYYKCTVYSFSFLGIGLDCHLLKYPKGSFIPPHTDDIDKKHHKRLNVLLRHASVGGIFKKCGIEQTGRIHYFRPDIEEHEVTEIKKGERLVLSFGMAM